MIRALTAPVAAAAATALLAAAHPIAQSTVREEPIALGARSGAVTATLTVPGGSRPAMVLIVGGSDAASKALAESLARDGIASVRGQTPPRKDTNPADDAAWIVQLRNDPRWSSITVAAYGDHSLTGMLAARAARADAFASIGMSTTPLLASALGVEVLRQTYPATALEDDATTAAALTGFVRRLKPPRHPEGERRSPRTLLMTEAARCRIAIEYGRLSKRGREIWGALVPFDKWWTPGADEAPVLTTSETIVFDGLTVPAGDYTLYTVPGAASFALIINRETAVYHTTYRPERDLGRVAMTMSPAPSTIEQLTFGVTPSTEGGTLMLGWDDRVYSAAFIVKRSDR
jgi:hypothetical protein